MDSHDGRVAGRPPRRGGLLRSPLFWVAAVAVILVAAVAAVTQLAGRPAGADPSPEASAATPPSASVPASSLGDSAAPSATAALSEAADAGELVLRLDTVCDVSPPQPIPRISVMADGTVVWHSYAELEPIQTRRLTADGLAELSEYLFSGGLFAESATYEPVRRPGTPEPPGHGVCSHTYTADDGAVVVRSTSWFGEEEESAYYEPAPERQALDLLAQELLDPESLVADDAWTGPASVYDGSEYQLLLHAVRDNFIPSTGSPDASEVPWPFDGPLDEFGQPGVDETYRCGNISREAAMAIIEALRSPDAEHPVVGPPYYWSLDWAEGNGWAEVNLVPLMPDGYPSCDDPL